MSTREINIQEFARDVERVCDFVIAKLKNQGKNVDTADAGVILDIKEKAADISTGRATITEDMFLGLADYMKGAPGP